MVDSDTALLEAAAYVMSCARTSMDEGGKYSVLRFLEVFKRLASISRTDGRTGDPLLIEITAEIERAQFELRLESEESRAEFTDVMIRKLTAELKRRSGLTPPSGDG